MALSGTANDDNLLLQSPTSGLQLQLSLQTLAGLAVNDLSLCSRQVSIHADTLLAPYAVVDNGQEKVTSFAYRAANPDLAQHFQMLSEHTCGLKDIFAGGDRDFEDLVVSFRPTSLIPAHAA